MTRPSNEPSVDPNAQIRRLQEMFLQSPSFSALLQGPEHRFVLTNPAYQQLIGHRDVIGLAAREAVPEIEQQGFIDLLDRAFTTGEALVGKDVKIVLQRSAGSPAETRYVDFVCQPIKDVAGNVTSIFVDGIDITDRHRTEEALRASQARLGQTAAINLYVDFKWVDHGVLRLYCIGFRRINRRLQFIKVHILENN